MYLQRSALMISPKRTGKRLSVFFPPARSVIIFGREVPVPVYRMQPGEKTREMLRIAEGLDDAAVRLAGLLHPEQIPARSVPLYCPSGSLTGGCRASSL